MKTGKREEKGGTRGRVGWRRRGGVEKEKEKPATGGSISSPPLEKRKGGKERRYKKEEIVAERMEVGGGEGEVEGKGWFEVRHRLPLYKTREASRRTLLNVRTVLELNVSIHRDANSRKSKEKSKDLVLIGRSSSLAYENIPIIFLNCIVSNLYTRKGSLILRK